MFLCARNITSDDRETMLGLFLPSSRYPDAAREKERERWNRLWSHGLPQGVILEDLSNAGRAEPMGVFVGAYVLPEVHDRIVRPGGPHLLDGLASAAEAGEGIPDDATIGTANKGGGLDIVVCWVGYGDAPHPPAVAASLRGHIVAEFQSLMSGNRLRRFTLETDDPDVRRRFEGYGLLPLRDENGTVVLSLHHDQAIESGDLASQRFFSYDPPVLGFSAAQRSILLLARQGFTDQEIANLLGRTTDSVKKRWGGIYARFAQAFPGRLPVGREGSRGAEKRRTLLAYLKDRPEELRPYGMDEGKGKGEEAERNE